MYLSLEDVLPLQRCGHNWQSLQEVLNYIAMCCCNKSISFSKTKTTDWKTKTTGRNIWMDILVCIDLLHKIVWTTLHQKNAPCVCTRYKHRTPPPLQHAFVHFYSVTWQSGIKGFSWFFRVIMFAGKWTEKRKY